MLILPARHFDTIANFSWGKLSRLSWMKLRFVFVLLSEPRVTTPHCLHSWKSEGYDSIPHSPEGFIVRCGGVGNTWHGIFIFCVQVRMLWILRMWRYTRPVIKEKCTTTNEPICGHRLFQKMCTFEINQHIHPIPSFFFQKSLPCMKTFDWTGARYRKVVTHSMWAMVPWTPSAC